MDQDRHRIASDKGGNIFSIYFKKYINTRAREANQSGQLFGLSIYCFPFVGGISAQGSKLNDEMCKQKSYTCGN